MSPPARSPGPVRGIRFIHRALIAEAHHLERLTGDLKVELETLAKGVNFLAEVVKAHTHSEEVAIFPGITTKMEFVVPAYLFDHQEEEALFKSMKQTLEQLAATQGEEQLKARRALHRDAIAVYEHIRLHATKEEELLIPLVEKISSPEEQSAQIEKMMSLFDADLMKRVMPWMIERLGRDDRLAYLTMLKGSLPAPAYQGVWETVRAGVSAGVAASIAALAP